jgi:hypothetical protein
MKINMCFTYVQLIKSAFFQPSERHFGRSFEAFPVTLLPGFKSISGRTTSGARINRYLAAVSGKGGAVNPDSDCDWSKKLGNASGPTCRFTIDLLGPIFQIGFGRNLHTKFNTNNTKLIQINTKFWFNSGPTCRFTIDLLGQFFKSVSAGIYTQNLIQIIQN